MTTTSYMVLTYLFPSLRQYGFFSLYSFGPRRSSTTLSDWRIVPTSSGPCKVSMTSPRHRVLGSVSKCDPDPIDVHRTGPNNLDRRKKPVYVRSGSLLFERRAKEGSETLRWFWPFHLRYLETSRSRKNKTFFFVCFFLESYSRCWGRRVWRKRDTRNV